MRTEREGGVDHPVGVLTSTDETRRVLTVDDFTVGVGGDSMSFGPTNIGILSEDRLTTVGSHVVLGVERDPFHSDPSSTSLSNPKIDLGPVLLSIPETIPTKESP